MHAYILFVCLGAYSKWYLKLTPDSVPSSGLILAQLMSRKPLRLPRREP